MPDTVALDRSEYSMHPARVRISSSSILSHLRAQYAERSLVGTMLHQGCNHPVHVKRRELLLRNMALV